jgi:PAS domain S-box-containing protein
LYLYNLLLKASLIAGLQLRFMLMGEAPMTAYRPVAVATGDNAGVDFERAFDQARTPLAVVRIAGREITLAAASAAFRDELGLAAQNVEGRRIECLFPADASLVLAGAIRHAAELGQPSHAMLESFGATTGARHEVVASALDDRTPARQVLLSVTTRNERAPRASSLSLDQLEALGEGQIFVFDIRRERARYISAELAHMVGHSMEDPLDMDAVRALVHPDDLEAVVTYFTNLGPIGGATVSHVTLRVARPEGGWRWFEVRGRALTLDSEGSPRSVLGVAVDVTERRAMSRALDRAARAVLRASDQERRRVARNLHDSTAQHLVAIDLGLSQLERRGPAGGPAAAVLRDMRTALAAAHREIRTYTYLLHPPHLQRLGLEETLRIFVEGFGRRSGLAIRVDIEGEAPANAETELAIFRVAQESLMNVHRHAGAHNAAVRLLRSPAAIVLEVEDDGVGLPDEAELARNRSDGVGIPGMQARMAQLGGSLDLIPLAPGLRVRAEAPL